MRSRSLSLPPRFPNRTCPRKSPQPFAGSELPTGRRGSSRRSSSRPNTCKGVRARPLSVDAGNQIRRRAEHRPTSALVVRRCVMEGGVRTQGVTGFDVPLLRERGPLRRAGHSSRLPPHATAVRPCLSPGHRPLRPPIFRDGDDVPGSSASAISERDGPQRRRSPPRHERGGPAPNVAGIHPGPLQRAG